MAEHTSGAPPRHGGNRLPRKPKLRVKAGIADTADKDYGLINKVNNMTDNVLGRTRSSSKHKGPDSRGRSTSKIGGDGRGSSQVRDTRDTELGGLARRGTSRQRSDSREPPANGHRGRSSSRHGSSEKGRSRSRIPGKGLLKKMRSLSRRRKSSKQRPEIPRGRDSSRRGFDTSDTESTNERSPHSRGIHARVSDDVVEIPRDPEDESDALRPQGGKKVSERIVTPHPVSQDLDSEGEDDEDEGTDDGDQEENDNESEEEEEPPKDPDAMSEESVMELDSKNSVLHVACLLHYRTQDILRLLQKDQSLAHEMNSVKELPLHYAAMDKKGVDPAVLSALLNLNPEAVQHPNVERSLPIHLMCMMGVPSKESLETLLEMCPDSVLVRSNFPAAFEDDMLDNVKFEASEEEEEEPEEEEEEPKPVDEATSNAFMDLLGYGTPAPPPPQKKKPKKRKPKKKKVFLDDALTEGTQKFETGWTPLHFAVMNGASPEVLRLLIEANTECLKIKSNRGRTALDCAQYMVRQHWLYGTDDESVVNKTFSAVEILEEAQIDLQ